MTTMTLILMTSNTIVPSTQSLFHQHRHNVFSLFSSLFLCLTVSLQSISFSPAQAFIFPASPYRPTFSDYSSYVGLKRDYGGVPRKKYGGCAVADLDGDGWPDLLFGHHDDRYTELYFNNRNGTFWKSPWASWKDTHALTPLRLAPWRRNMHFMQSQGGSYGLNPKPPSLLHVNYDRTIINESLNSGLYSARGRGRSVVPMTLHRDKTKRVHIVVLNASPIDSKDIGNQHGFEATADSSNLTTFEEIDLGDFKWRNRNPYGSVTDVDGDGFVELVTWHQFAMHTTAYGRTLHDISLSVLPRSLHGLHGVVAIAELDYDNDGWWDLYIARTNTSDLSYLNNYDNITDFDDILLRNIGGRYTDVTAYAGIPGFSGTRGVTTGDFNNDGWIDIIVTQHETPDYLLLNKGDGTFETIYSIFEPRVPSTAVGDMATAIDYDRDGRLDVVLSEGDYFDAAKGGQYRMMKNIATYIGGFLLVRVGSSPYQRASISLHAVVHVFVSSSRQMRRVGSPGTAVSNSYIELCHFGVGFAHIIDRVVVRWVDGAVQEQINVTPGSYLEFGDIPETNDYY